VLEAAELDERLRRDRIDVTLPGARVERGFAHLIEQTGREILEVLVGLGYRISDGPEVDTVYRNFDALNHAPTHPTRQATDTYYIDENTVLRTHTSPMQIRTMQSQPPPVYMATMGRCYRRDTPDATHTAMFTQIEGLAIDRGLSLAHLKGTLLAFAREIFGADREVRLRPHFFPFTEPSVEVDVSCFNCARDGSPCRVCKGEGWVEVLGAGMVDPALFGYVEGYDPELWTGYAWGMGVERIAALRHAVPDIRWLWENDLRLMEQFG
jgi:phenylalanyl-tRNA synthetase alpha chain